MKKLWKNSVLVLILSVYSGQACAAGLASEQNRLVATLKQDLSRIRQEIERGTKEYEAYSGGLIKVLISMRLEILKTNEVLIEQRINAVESGAPITVVVNTTKPDPSRAAELATEVERQQARIAEARAEANLYAGGLVKAMAETAVATNQSTLAMLEQQYLIAKYGLAIPAVEATQFLPPETGLKDTLTPTSSPQTPGDLSRPDAGACLKIETFDSSVLSANDVFTELAWKADISNSCSEAFSVRVTFTIYDKDEFKLDSDSEDANVPAGGTGKARGKMLVSPKDKARRIANQGVSLSLR
jgi:hypothetical protein